jgi:adenine-specific DNA-methyltransferase
MSNAVFERPTLNSPYGLPAHNWDLDSDKIASWSIDTDYNEESYFVRHTHSLGASDSYKSLMTILKAEIDGDAWATLHSDTSWLFTKPKSSRIVVKVINHPEHEVIEVFRV